MWAISKELDAASKPNNDQENENRSWPSASDRPVRAGTRIPAKSARWEWECTAQKEYAHWDAGRKLVAGIDDLVVHGSWLDNSVKVHCLLISTGTC